VHRQDEVDAGMALQPTAVARNQAASATRYCRPQTFNSSTSCSTVSQPDPGSRST